MGWVIDLDGVMWLGEVPSPRSADAIRRLMVAGESVLFVTNNSSVPVADVEAKLGSHGVDAAGLVVTSALAAASLLEAGERAFVCGGAGVVEALVARGVDIVSAADAARVPVDSVVVGFTRAFDFEMLSAATLAVRAGARLIGTNSDPTYPTPDGQVPGGGAILAAVVAASGVEPIVAGKPNEPMASLVRGRLGPSGVVVGDRQDTDGLFAVTLGYRFALVQTGVTPGEASTGDVDLFDAVDRLFDGVM